MRLSRLAIAVLTVIVGLAVSTSASALTVNSASTPTTISWTIPSGSFNESSPAFVHGSNAGNWFQYLITTAHSYDCQTPESQTGSSVNCSGYGYSSLATKPEREWHPHDAGNIPSGTDHKRNYFGQFDGEYLPNKSSPTSILSVMHGENKNEYDPDGSGYQYHNSVLPADNTCWSGDPDGAGPQPYTECWHDYFGFISAVHSDVNAGTNWGLAPWYDYGPIVWPHYGYKTSGGSKASWGVRHPSTIVQSDTVYMFYFDTGYVGASEPTNLVTQGGNAGIMVARAPISSGGASGTWKVWDGGTWINALPSGLTAANQASYFSTAGPYAFPIIINEGVYGIKVAKLAQGGFISVEGAAVANSSSCGGQTAYKTRLRTSSDIIHWSAPVDVTSFTGCGSNADVAYLNAGLRDPRFLNAAGDDQKLVDATSFYLVGTSNNGVARSHLAITP